MMSNGQNVSKKRKTSWRSDYATKYGFLKQAVGEDEIAFCTICNSKFTVWSHGGEGDIKKHIGTVKHNSAIKASTSSAKLQNYFNNFNSSQELETSAKEGAWAYHTAKHNISLRSNDCSSALIRSTFETKFSLGRTKCAAIIESVIGPLIDKNVSSKLENMNFVSLITDTSNRLNVKMLPIVARGFDPETGVCCL